MRIKATRQEVDGRYWNKSKNKEDRLGKKRQKEEKQEF